MLQLLEGVICKKKQGGIMKILKKFFVFALILTFIVSGSVGVSADEVKEQNPQVTYLEDSGEFYITNSTIEEVFKQFDESEDFVPDLTQNLDLANTRSTVTPYAVSKNYYLSRNVVGVKNSSFNIQWGVTVDIKVVNYNGTNYDMFVKVTDSAVGLSSGSYEISSSGAITTKILNAGATVEVPQFLQFQTTTTYSSGISVGPDFFQASAGTGGQYYYRTNLNKYSARYNLPLLNIIQ